MEDKCEDGRGGGGGVPHSIGFLALFKVFEPGG